MNPLCEKPATELSRLLSAGEISAEELTRAHLNRIDTVDKKLRAFTVVLRDEALATARRLDEERRAGQVRGPLHGLPVSIKESLDCAGQASTLGVSSRKEVIAREDAGVVELLRRAGAVILGRTNVSQLLLYHESRNPLFGQTSNPFSLAHTPGGSSGGEASAIAGGLSPLGIGTDIGGSIRVPAHFCGIAGLKPTLDRWTNKGSNGALVGQEAIRSQLGPMARTVGDLVMVMQALDPKAMTALDPRVPPLPFEDPRKIDLTKLKVGVYTDDGLLPPSAAVARAVREAAAALRAKGCTVVEFTPPGLQGAVYDYFATLSADGGATVMRLFADGRVDPSLSSLRTVARMPAAVRGAAARAAGMAGEKRLERFLSAMGEKSVADLWRLTAQLRNVRAAILAAMKAEAIDLILCPIHATAALPHGMSKDFALAGSPSMIWNLVQFPAGAVPVSRVRSSEATREKPKDRLEKKASEVDQQSVGLPVGVQVVARPWEEDRVLAAMLAIEEMASQNRDFPRTPAFLS
ncbi:MAG: amidase family protein [Byssovorax sp.]